MQGGRTILSMMVLGSFVTGVVPAAEVRSQSELETLVPPYLDSEDAVTLEGVDAPPDSTAWSQAAYRTAAVAMKNTGGEDRAKVRLRVSGKGDLLGTPLAQQTMLVYDNSGSMAWNDKNNSRCAGMNQYIDRLKTPSEIGAVEFDSKRSVLSASFSSVKTSLYCFTGGSSKMDEGLRLALEELSPKLKAGFVHSIVFITDSATEGNPGAYVSQAASKGIRINTVCIGTACSVSDLASWAKQTGGSFGWAKSDSTIVETIARIASTYYTAGQAPKGGQSMLRFQIGSKIEVVNGSFRVPTGSSCQLLANMTPDKPATIPSVNNGLTLEWVAPSARFGIDECWEVEFNVRSLSPGIGMQLNDGALSFVLYDGYDGSPGKSDLAGQLFLDSTRPEPQVIETIPGDSALAVPLNQSVTVRFDHLMEPGPTAAAFSIVPAVTGSQGLVQGDTLTWSHSGLFNESTAYKVIIGSSAKSLGGVAMISDFSFNFTAASGSNQTGAPTVLSTRPLNGQNNVPVNTRIGITFNQPMTKSATENAIKSLPAITGGFNWSQNDAELGLNPTMDLAANTLYTITVGAGATSRGGFPIAKPWVFKFTSGGGRDTSPPAIVHAPVTHASTGDAITIMAQVTDDYGVGSVALYFRQSGGPFRIQSMSEAAGSYSTTLASSDVKTGTLEYYIEALDLTGNRASSPDGAPSQVHSVQISAVAPGPFPGINYATLLAILGAVVGGIAVGVAAVRFRRRGVIEEAFLLYRDGRLLKHYSRRIRPLDADVYTSMLSAVQAFVADSRQGDTQHQLEELKVGENRILLEQGRLVSLAVEYKGRGQDKLRTQMKSCIIKLESSLGAMLESWDGTFSAIGPPTERVLEEFTGKRY